MSSMSFEARQHAKRCWWDWLEVKWQCAEDCPTYFDLGMAIHEEPPSVDPEARPSKAS
jgi:hypothetical protein